MRACKDNIWYPLADSASVVAGLTWVLHANQVEDDSRPQAGTVDATGNARLTSGPPTEDLSWEKDLGYGVMGLFGASALYGFYVEIACAKARHEIDRQHELASGITGKPRAAMPATVAGFTFETSVAQAQQACLAQGEDWKLEGSSAECSRTAKSAAAARDVQLQFRLGALTQVALIFKLPPEDLNVQYEQLTTSLINLYDKPQVGGGPLVGECATSLAACLANDQKVSGRTWHWPSGSIELTPVWRDEHSLLELRYSHEDPQAE